MLSPADQPPVLIDTQAIAAELAQLAADYAGRERELRTAVAQRLKWAVAQGRQAAEEAVMADRQGRAWAARLCRMQDDILRIVYGRTVRLYRPPAVAVAES